MASDLSTSEFNGSFSLSDDGMDEISLLDPLVI